MPTKDRQKTEFGDFQTPEGLAYQVCELLCRLGVSPVSIVEPTCGTGSFLRASESAFPNCIRILGFEVNPDYIQAAKTVERAEIHCEDFFEKDWHGTLDSLQEPILVVGNPPWVTNSAVGSLGGSNLPTKSNFQRLNGFDAITGKSNFDISEWMILHLLEWLSGRDASLAMLCKTTVARKVLRHAWSRNLQISTSAIYLIDAAQHFAASVDACLLISVLKPGANSNECAIYSDLEASTTDHSKFAFRDGLLISDLDLFNSHGHMAGASPLKWRSGVKHDCSPVIELRRRGDVEYENGLGEVVNLEPTYLYPMLKSSHLMKPTPSPSRFMLVPQRSIGEDTSRIEKEAPRTWEYLQSHSDRLDARLSSIYKNRPRFSIFGVGPYSFAPWKVAISGFSKHLDFRAVGPVEQRPVMLDDTCYFLPCNTEHDAMFLVELLNSNAAKGFFHSLVFWDAKRPITAHLLATLDIRKLVEKAEVSIPTWSDIPEESPANIAKCKTHSHT